MFVKIKAASGQVKTTEVEGDGNILAQAFIENKVINDFSDSLPQRHKELNEEVIKKMSALVGENKTAS